MKTGTISRTRRAIALGGSSALATTLAGMPRLVAAQEAFPTRAVEVIVPWGPGGGSDFTARMLARFLEAELKTPFPVINAPGANGIIGIQKLLVNPADGYTMGVSGDYYAAVGSPDAKWKLDEFIPLAVLINQPGAIFVSQTSRFETWQDVEREARAKPETVTIVMAGLGIIDEVHTNYLVSKGIRLNVLPYPRPGERYTAILGGHADLLYEQAGDIKSFLESKRMRPLLSLTAERFPLFPDVPTARELGYNLTTPQVRWAYMKAGTDPQRVKIIADAIEKLSKSAEYEAYLKAEFAAPDSFVPARDARRYIQSMLETVRREAREAGLKTAALTRHPPS